MSWADAADFIAFHMSLGATGAFVAWLLGVMFSVVRSLLRDS